MRKLEKKLLAEVAAEVLAIYQNVEEMPLERTCTGRTDCCHFKLTGRTPHLTRGEALVAVRGMRASGKKTLPGSANGACPLLKEGKCSIYPHRPFGCRTHFCKAAGGPYEREYVRDWIRQLERIDARLGGAGGVNFFSAMEWAEEAI